MIHRYDSVLETLLDSDSSLRNLAMCAGYDLFSFYQGADLENLDLSGQDLSGMNFRKANLSGSNLSDVKFDPGAFNGSIIDEKYSNRIDGFEFSLDDIFSAERYGLYFFGRFRAESLEYAISKTKLTYGEFSDYAKINAQTLRKARKSVIVAGDTIVAICSAILQNTHDEHSNDLFENDSRIRQPFIQLLDLTKSGKFLLISQEKFNIIFQKEMEAEFDSGPLSPKKYKMSMASFEWVVQHRHILENFNS